MSSSIVNVFSLNTVLNNSNKLSPFVFSVMKTGKSLNLNTSLLNQNRYESLSSSSNRKPRIVSSKRRKAETRELSQKLMSYANSTIDENDLSPKISTTQIKRKKRTTNSNKYKTKKSSDGDKKKIKKEKIKKIEDIIEDDNQSVEEDIDITLDKENLNKVMAYCTAEGYNIEKLSSILNKNYAECTSVTNDILKIKFNNDNNNEAYIFADGTVVSWGPEEAENLKLLNKIKKAEIKRLKIHEYEWFNYIENNNIPGGMKDDIVYIGNALSADEAKLAFSTGFSRSVKLSVLEDLLDQYLYKNKWIPDYLSRGKRLPLSRTQVLQRIGELFQLRGSANLYTDLLDTPDFCWSSDQLAEYFGNISRVLEIRSRMSIFNRKLDYANDMSSLMKSHLKERHNFKLEWIIITLIAIEVFAGGVTVLEKLGYINFDRFHKHYTDVKIENVDNDSELLKDEKKYIEDTK
ncbi:hypothetical protein H8356DRAFT_1037471 [Neocallimastix lanati (nom. inval.)]|jgi:uncharacterized Rmd1/YagE family protein|nr:hypothetical protein H8356DRAFT_1037471 [Neocallimastix sp. JGI-2020a]